MSYILSMVCPTATGELETLHWTRSTEAECLSIAADAQKYEACTLIGIEKEI